MKLPLAIFLKSSILDVLHGFEQASAFQALCPDLLGSYYSAIKL